MTTPDQSGQSPEEREHLERMRRMEQMAQMTPEDMRRLVEEATAQAQAAMDRMSPEERERAEAEAQRMMDESMCEAQELVNQARQVLGETVPAAASAPAALAAQQPNFCGNCGARVEGGNFCANCGHAL